MPAFYLLTLLLIVLLAWISYRSNKLLQTLDFEMNLLLEPGETIFRLVLIVACYFLGVLSGLPPAVLGWTPHISPVWLVICPAIAAAMQVCINRSVSYARQRFGNEIYSSRVMRSMLPRGRRQWPLIVAALFPAVLFEELLFRSLLIGGFSLLFPPILIALITAPLFGWMHAAQGKWAIVVAGFISFILSLLFIWQRSLVIPFLVHYMLDALQIAYASRHPEELALPAFSGVVQNVLDPLFLEDRRFHHPLADKLSERSII
jgi:hypothetical protein